MTTALDAATWQAHAAAHGERVDELVSEHLARRGAQVKHPVHDFLFTYYSYRPSQLRRWHPGFGIELVDGAPAYGSLKGYGVATGSTTGTSTGTSTGTAMQASVTSEHVASQRPLLQALHRLLRATAGRPAQLGCFGLHEWAMVYGLSEKETRHAEWPLRLGGSGTDEVVESHRIACSHFDAYRFFTPPARPLNTLSPGREDRAEFEQPGCLHAGMDLYKHAFRLSPMISSDLVADCFELARDIRLLDMQAAPYDLADLGVEPVRIETAEGKATYAAAQRGFAERGTPLRERLVEACARLLSVADSSVTSPLTSSDDARGDLLP